jgi:hypothetical protein
MLRYRRLRRLGRVLHFDLDLHPLPHALHAADDDAIAF